VTFIKERLGSSKWGTDDEMVETVETVTTTPRKEMM
jgi:hypothetical protein